MDSLPQKRILAAYRMRVAPIEELFAMGKIGPVQRREFLEHARDLAGVTAMRVSLAGGGNTPTPPLSHEAYNFKRREENRRRRARKRAAREAQAMGGAHA